jgi:hypothetical protein
VKLYYYLYRKFKHIPHPAEINQILYKGLVKRNSALYPVAIAYAYGFNIESIAAANQITRERVRQYLWKVTRIGKPKGFIWITACFTKGNFRLFPVGYIK